MTEVMQTVPMNICNTRRRTVNTGRSSSARREHSTRRVQATVDTGVDAQGSAGQEVRCNVDLAVSKEARELVLLERQNIELLLKASAFQ